jgi:Yip1 domain
MTTPAASSEPPVETGSDSLLSRLIGVVLSPRDTYQRIVARPRWVGALALVTLVVAGISFVLLSTETGQMALLDQQVRQTENFGQTVTDAQYEQMERMAPMMRYFVGGSQLVFIPLVTLAIAGLLLAFFNAGLGGDATFKQVMAVVTHGGAISILQQLFVAPLNYVRGSMSSATNLGVFAQAFADDTSFVARFLGMIDLFIIWNLIVVAIGLGVLYRRRTQPIAIGLLTVYGVIALIIAVIMSVSSGGS